MLKLRSRVCGSGIEKSEKSHKAPSNSHFDKEVCPSHIFFSGHLVSVQFKINFHFVPFSSTHRLSFSSSEEDNEDDEEDDKDEKDLDHQPAVGRDWLEVFEDLCVGALHVQLGVLNVGVDPVREWQEKGKQMMC